MTHSDEVNVLFVSIVYRVYKNKIKQMNLHETSIAISDNRKI